MVPAPTEKIATCTRSITLTLSLAYTRKCTTLWGEPDRVHMQNMEQYHAFDCHQNVAEPQAAENHVKYTRVHRNCESGLVIIYKHYAHRLVQHKLQVVEMASTDDNTLAIFFTCATGSLHAL